jgi:hypothetical protein
MRSLRRTVMIASLVTALTGAVVGVAAVPAQAATRTVRLDIRGGNGCGSLVDLVVSGQVDEANPISQVRADFWGADGGIFGSDDHLIGPLNLAPVGGGAFFSADVCIASSVLDEDVGQDEVYANVTVIGNGRSITVRTNEIHANF